MRVLFYSDLETGKLKKSIGKVIEAIERDDFKSAEVKKLSPSQYYRAKIDETNRLLLQFVQYKSQTVCLALEVILNHAYEKSRFLRGARVVEDKILEPDQAVAMPVRYLNPKSKNFYFLDKVISFDDTQDVVFRTPCPLIVVGSAGSGKTALTLERLRQQAGRVLYVTQSAFLARSAAELYFSHGFENPSQEPEFLSYQEFLETLHLPEGREVRYSDWAKFYAQNKLKFADAHQVLEEIRGVLTSRTSGPLDLPSYLELGVKQSIFAVPERKSVFEVFQKYQRWLTQNNLFDVNLTSFAWQQYATPTYDFIVIDEVQDLTVVQLGLIFQTLIKPTQFLLCGDSNQIVHPNLFSWGAVKSLFWQDEKLAEQQRLSVLQVNFRNATEVTRVANAVLKVKHSRFGSIDRESNFLVQPALEQTGLVESLPNQDTVRRSLNEASQASTQFAVLVLRDEDKPNAKKDFKTPLVFSVHEAKGLEYSNVILYNMISSQRQIFADIAEGVSLQDLEQEELAYRRAKDKTDKSLEIYKFFINALYVALTRATDKVYLLETDQNHPLLNLLKVQIGSSVKLEQSRSSRTDWEREAHKLELQGKLEQAQAIRSQILKVKPVPWEVVSWLQLEQKSFDKAQISSKAQATLLEQAIFHRQYQHIERLHEMKFAPASAFLSANQTERGWKQKAVSEKLLANLKNLSAAQILRQCDEYGVDYRNPMAVTPLMTAAQDGNLELVKTLLERGADRDLTDPFGHTAYLMALNRALEDGVYCTQTFPELHDLLAPSSFDVQQDGKLTRIYPYMGEYYFLSVMLARYKVKAAHMHEMLLENQARKNARIRTEYQKMLDQRIRLTKDQLSIFQNKDNFPADHWQKERSKSQQKLLFPSEELFRADDFGVHLEQMSDNVLLEKRKKRTYFNHVLSRAEINSSYHPARKLWIRVLQGLYHLNPEVRFRTKNMRGEEVWKTPKELLRIGFWHFDRRYALQIPGPEEEA